MGRFVGQEFEGELHVEGKKSIIYTVTTRTV